jgi:hypothetical protein
MKKTLLLALVPFISGCGFAFVKGPPSGWQEIQDVDALETRALIQPCTSSRTLVWVDAIAGVGGVASMFEYDTGFDSVDENVAKLGYGLMGLAGGVGAIVGLTKVNDCRAFNARLLQERRGDEQASHEWLDELFPLPDLGVTGLDPVFGVPINQDH